MSQILRSTFLYAKKYPVLIELMNKIFDNSLELVAVAAQNSVTPFDVDNHEKVFFRLSPTSLLYGLNSFPLLLYVFRRRANCTAT